ncbi:SAM-dependent methyltransferase [Nonlabens sp. Asnod2-A12]|uniref:SAM-dependent methyltransferase n=1 Tax=Nonlabens sp. Asnod2-A12 TaxID=3160578 RepID=UPI00386EF659
MESINLSTQLESNEKEITTVDLYDEATQDYEFWSKDFNMHFGYYSFNSTSLLKRDTMLNEMNNQVLKRLHVLKGDKTMIDLGCGVGNSMRYALSRNSDLKATGVTLSKYQVDLGNQLLEPYNTSIELQNYNNTSFDSNSFDAALAIESFCHGGHSITSLREAHRILKPGRRLVIADAFLKKNHQQLCSGGRFAYNKLCNHWDLDQLENINNYKFNLEKVGFKNIKVEDVSFRVAPSVLHVPFAIAGFVIKELFNKRTFKKESLHNLKGSFYALLSGLHMKSFGYYLITATKG